MDEGARQTRSAADQLAIGPQRASLALDAARMGEFEWDADRQRLFISERMAAITGLPADEMSTETGPFFAQVHPDDAARLAKSIEQCLASCERVEVEFRFTRPDDGRMIWLHGVAANLAGDSGVRRLVGILQEVTERKTEDGARNAMVAELDHRVKNVLAAVQSLASQSARRTTSLDAFLKTFAGRLEAMASAHTLLTATRWRGADIGNIAAAELGGLAPGQAHWSGPEVILNPRATNALTLALHELATNAVKFGALSADAGRVEVSWTRCPEGGFHLIWTERGGPPVNPPERRGFGATLLERVTGRELGGEARLEFRPGGVRASITADVTALAGGTVNAEPVATKQPEAAAPAPQAGASSGVVSADGVRGRRILIVEDAVLLALELEAGLTEAGAVVIGTASNVEEALKLAETPFDVAVLDANLNGAPVTPVAAVLRIMGKPFIFATGYGDAAPAPEGFDAPVVRKPYNVAQIAAAVAEALGRGGS